MYQPENPKPHFIPGDIVKIKKTGDLAIIRESNLNLCQSSDESQWSYSIIPIDNNYIDQIAWFNFAELIFINNIFEILGKSLGGDRSIGSYKFSLTSQRR